MPKRKFTFSLVVSLFLLAAATSRAQVTNTPGVDVYDGFETPALSKVWETSRFAAGAVEMQTNIVRAGRSAARIVVRPRDVFEAGINGNSDSERAELAEARKSISRENQAY